MRESITFGHLFGLLRKNTWGKIIQEQHTMRNIYFVLFVTERYNCIAGGLPLILEPLDQALDTISSFIVLIKMKTGSAKA